MEGYERRVFQWRKQVKSPGLELGQGIGCYMNLVYWRKSRLAGVLWLHCVRGSYEVT